MNNVTEKVSEVKEKVSELSDKFSELEGFRRLWVIVSIALFALLFLLLLIGKGPWCDDCNADDPELTNRIASLEKENAQIIGLKSDIDELSKSKEKLASLEVYTKGLQRENAAIVVLKTRIKELEKISSKARTQLTGLESSVDELEKSKALLADLKTNNKMLRRDNATITVLKNRIKQLEGVTRKSEATIASLQETSANAELSFEELTKSKELLANLKTNIKSLKRDNATIVVLKNRIKELEKITKRGEAKIAELQENSVSAESNVEALAKSEAVLADLKANIKTLQRDNATIVVLKNRIKELEKKNSSIEGLQAKIEMLETTEASLVDPTESNIEAISPEVVEKLESEKTVLMERITELEKSNGLIPGLKAKIEALENIDINFVKEENTTTTANITKIYFEPGSSRFPTDSNKSIADVITYLESNESLKVELLGFHDATGNARWNIHLATKRSERVKQLLLDSGLSADRIIVGQPSHTLGTGKSEEARRVEVKIITE